jgi:hypothetical protein
MNRHSTLLACLVVLLVHFDVAAQSYTIYVAPPTVPPNPVQDGSAGNPYTTLEGARDHIRGHPDRYSANWNVKLRKNSQGNGVFRRTSPFILDPQDKGGSGFRVDYQAGASGTDPFDDVLISGGVNISSWFHAPPPYSYWVASIPVNPATGFPYKFRDVYFNNSRLTRARWPNLGSQHQENFTRVTYTGLYFSDLYRYYRVEQSFVPAPTQYEPIEMVARITFVSPRQVISEIQQNTSGFSTLYFYHKQPFGWSAPCGAPTVPEQSGGYTYFYGWQQVRGRPLSDGFPAYAARPLNACDTGTQVFLENSYSFLDQCYEWYATDDQLLVLLPGGIDPNATANTITIPVATSLLELRYVNDANRVQNVSFTRLNFAFTEAPLPRINSKTEPSQPYACGSWDLRSRPGYLAGGNGLAYNPGPAPNTLYGNGDLILPGAVLFDRTRDCWIRQCRVAHTGGHGIIVNGIGNRVEGCKIFDLGGSGIAEVTPTNLLGCAPVWGCRINNVLLYNHIFDFGINYRDSSGILISWQRFEAPLPVGRVQGNWIARGGYNGICLGLCSGFCDVGQSGMELINNRIEDVMRVLTDGGGIYTTGPYPNSTMTGNWIRRTRIDPVYDSRTWGSGALYFDNGAEYPGHWTVSNNVFEETYRAGVACSDPEPFPNRPSPPCQPILFNVQLSPCDATSFTWGYNYSDALPMHDNPDNPSGCVVPNALPINSTAEQIKLQAGTPASVLATYWPFYRVNPQIDPPGTQAGTLPPLLLLDCTPPADIN